jgi:hypothetical protein
VEKYLIEIARYYNVVYDPDPQVSFCIYSSDFRGFFSRDAPDIRPDNPVFFDIRPDTR